MSDLILSNPQHVFLNELNTKYRAYVGGFGSGKTYVGCIDQLRFFAQHPGTRQGYFGPTYPAIRDIFYPTLDECAHTMGFKVNINEGNKEAHIYRGRWYYGTSICRSMEKPDSIVGFKVARALVDEIDTLAHAKARNAWNKIIARLRLTIPGVQNGIGVTTTPEGFKFTYERFAKSPKADYSMVQASTYENAAHLPPDYIESLFESYPAELISAYIRGQFVNLNSGAVYVGFDRHLNATTRKWDGVEPVHIGMDFNVGRMCAVVHVIDDDEPRAVDEITGGYDTPDMIRVIQERYGHTSVTVYPDSSGDNRKSVGASQTDISLLQAAGFTCEYNPANPTIRDRVNSMNAMFYNGEGSRRYLINTARCPRYTQKLEQQAYANGVPEKDGTEDVNDAGGYFIAHRYAINRPALFDLGVRRFGT